MKKTQFQSLITFICTFGTFDYQCFDVSYIIFTLSSKNFQEGSFCWFTARYKTSNRFSCRSENLNLELGQDSDVWKRNDFSTNALCFTSNKLKVQAFNEEVKPRVTEKHYFHHRVMSTLLTFLGSLGFSNFPQRESEQNYLASKGIQV